MREGGFQEMDAVRYFSVFWQFDALKKQERTKNQLDCEGCNDLNVCNRDWKLFDEFRAHVYMYTLLYIIYNIYIYVYM